MSTIWDRIHHEPLPEHVTLAKTEAFDTTEVVRMVWEHERDDIMNWDSLPNLAPPFEQIFMFANTAGISYRVSGQSLPSVEGSMGSLFTSMKTPSGWDVHVRFVGGTRSSGPVWQPYVLAYQVRASGELATGAIQGKDFALFSIGMPMEIPAGVTAKQFLNAFSGLAYPHMLAISMLHCKNVRAKKVVAPIALVKASAKRGRPLYTHSVLDIKPMRKVLESEGGIGSGSTLSKALHVCRGHFKDYRAGCGLFGKHKDIYWWDSAVRGSVESGVHVKDYRVSV